jgi:hypothetical protein
MITRCNTNDLIGCSTRTPTNKWIWTAYKDATLDAVKNGTNGITPRQMRFEWSAKPQHVLVHLRFVVGTRVGFQLK